MPCDPCCSRASAVRVYCAVDGTKGRRSGSFPCQPSEGPLLRRQYLCDSREGACRGYGSGEFSLQQGTAGRSRTKRWLMRFPRAMPAAIFVLIAAITLLSVFAIERGEDSRHAAQLRARATSVASALERRANASSAYLRAGAALLATLNDVPIAQFRRFVSELRLDAD